MEKENIAKEQFESAEETTSGLHTITPLSKYLAMALFIILPFLGGWIGYTYAPEKIVEVEKIIEVEKKTEPVPFSTVDKKFYTNDSDYPSGRGNTDFVLEDETLFWNHDYGNGWASTTVSNPEELEYIAKGILTDGKEVYSPHPLFSRDKIPVAEDGIKVLGNKGMVLVINGQDVYVVHSYQMVTLSENPIRTSTPESVEIIGSGFFKAAGQVYFSSDTTSTILEVAEADAATIKPLELGFASDQNSVFYKDKKLAGVDPTTVSFETQRGYRFMIADDRVWVPHGCSPIWYEEIPLSELSSYTNC